MNTEQGDAYAERLGIGDRPQNRKFVPKPHIAILAPTHDDSQIALILQDEGSNEIEPGRAGDTSRP